MVAPWVFIQRLKSQNRPFKKYHNTFCCHFLLQTFAQVLFSILSQEKLNTMLMQNFRGTTKSIMVFLQKAYNVQNKSYFLKELLNRYYLHGHSIRLKLQSYMLNNQYHVNFLLKRCYLNGPIMGYQSISPRRKSQNCILHCKQCKKEMLN